MMYLSWALSAAVLLSSATEAAAGTGGLLFCLGMKKADGSCKFKADYDADLVALAPYSKTVRIYSSSDCDTMQQLMPAAKAAGFKVMLGVWPTDDAHFELEKSVVSKFLPTYKDNVYGITVGSEALYRGDLTGTQLAQKINDMKTLVSGLGVFVPVGTADSWNKYIEGDASPVISASDLILVNGFSFWQAQSPANMTGAFFDYAVQSLARIQAIKGNTPFTYWIGETGWPTQGNTYGAATPDITTARKFWKEAICGLRAWSINVGVFEAFDEPWKPKATSDTGIELPETSWGVMTVDRELKYSLDC